MTSEGGWGFVSATHRWGWDGERGLLESVSPHRNPTSPKHGAGGGGGAGRGRQKALAVIPRQEGSGGWVGRAALCPTGSLASDFKGLEEVFAAGFSPTLAFNTDPLLGGAGEPSQAKVGVHAGALHVHGVHCGVTAGGGGTC